VAPGRESPDDRYTQPVCAEPLDDVVRRHRLPPPQAIRIAVRSGADEVLRGAAGVLETHRPRSILVMLKDAGEPPPCRRPRPLGYGAPAADARRPGVTCARARSAGRGQSLGRAPRAAGRVRARG
jgi:hypothetical protein